MDFRLDETKLLYGLGAFLGVAAILYFGHELILYLSPTIKSFILLSGTAAFLASAEYVEHRILKSSFYIFSAFSYLSLLTYIFARFSFGSQQIFLILAASSAVFIGLGYLRSEKGYKITTNQAQKALIAIIVLVFLAVVADIAGPQPQYSLELKDNVEVTEGEEFELGVVEIRNDFPLSRNIETPGFRGCLIPEKGEKRPVYLNPENEEIIRGSSVKRISLTHTVHSRPDHNITISGNYTVERADCPESPTPRTIYIQETDSSRPVLDVTRE